MIETDRLVLREFRPEDWAELHEYLSDPAVVRFEPYEVYTQEQCRQEALRRSTDRAFLALCLKQSGKLIGNLYAGEGDFSTWEVGYVLNGRYQGHGYATEAARALVEHLFVEKGAHRVVAHCNPQNDRSWRLLERLGMRREGYLRQNIFFKRDAEGNPLWADTYAYAILSSEWGEHTGERTDAP